MPIWKMIMECAQKLTREGNVPFTRQDIIERIRRIRPNAKPDVINPIIQGLTDNLKGGVPSAGGHMLHSVGRGLFKLITNEASSEADVTSGARTESRAATKKEEQMSYRIAQPSGGRKHLPANKLAIGVLDVKQRRKLRVAAEILKRTADIYDGTKYLRPHWAAGVITHGQPKIQECIIGITEEAEKSAVEELTQDHLYRVTETAEYILTRANGLSIEEIEEILLDRSIKMVTTRSQNNSVLRKAIKKCQNKDDWQELYRVAGIKYRLY